MISRLVLLARVLSTTLVVLLFRPIIFLRRERAKQSRRLWDGLGIRGTTPDGLWRPPGRRPILLEKLGAEEGITDEERGGMEGLGIGCGRSAGERRQAAGSDVRYGDEIIR